MPRYDNVYKTLAERTTAQGTIDLNAFVAMQKDAGATDERIVELLIEDLEEDGPIFGKFTRGLTGAATSAVRSAARQGEIAGTVASDPRLRRLAEEAGVDVDAAIESADPGSMLLLENAVVAEERFTWVAELINTCHRCLPLHGQTLTYAEWQARGLLPDTIHSGWDSSCHCRLVPSGLTDGRSDLVAPLKRTRLKTDGGLKGLKKTVRAVTQNDIDAALKARDEAVAMIDAVETLPDGTKRTVKVPKNTQAARTLRLLGQANR